jgi:hypothetical protein
LIFFLGKPKQGFFFPYNRNLSNTFQRFQRFIKAAKYMMSPWVCQAYLFGFIYLGLPTLAALTLEERLHQFLISFLYVQPGRAE